MSDAVDRIKELLFDQETRELGALGQRVNQLFERAGSKERFEASVAEVIDGALRKAEVERHDELAGSLAPVVVRTIKTELRNSQDELVEALYPMTGRMVKAYIASAMKDLVNDINTRLETNPVMLRLRSLTTGKSMAELALADAQRLHVEELYLIRRGTGELLWRWPETAGEGVGRDHVMSGILTAINEFSNDALGSDGSALRQIDLGERRLYLRASPVYLLAAKCSGVANRSVESFLDEGFLKAIERLHALPGDARADGKTLLDDFSDDLSREIEEKHRQATGRRGTSPLKVVLLLVAIPFAAWAAWHFYTGYRTERVREIATRTVAAAPGLGGYPITVSVGPKGETLTVTGLAPSAEAKASLAAKLTTALPNTKITDELTVLPSEIGEIEPRIAEVREAVQGLKPEVAGVVTRVEGLEPRIAGVRSDVTRLESGVNAAVVARALDRAKRKLDLASAELPHVAAALTESKARSVVADTSRAVDNLRSGVRSARAGVAAGEADGAGAPTLEKLIGEAEGAAAALVPLLPAGTSDRRPAAAPSTGQVTDADRAERLADAADWLATLTLSAGQLAAVRNAIPPPAEASPREKLDAWTRGHAVFFGNKTDYREPDRAKAHLAELAALVASAGIPVRVVGYTDEKGQTESNTPLSVSRARKVVGDLVALGVPEALLIPLGRVDTNHISPEIGEQSPNRRVEFEVAFDGEVGR